MVGINSQHSRVFDADLFFQQCEFLAEPIVLGSEPDSSVETIRRPTARVDRSRIAPGR